MEWHNQAVVKTGKRLGPGVLIIILFMVVGFLTIEDYGITWDEPENFLSGRNYLSFFFTLDTSYLDFAQLDKLYQASPSPPLFYGKWFYYQRAYPPFANTVSAATSIILSDVLHILSPIAGHHVTVVLFAASALFCVYMFALDAYGRQVAIFATISLALFPLFYGHSHNNIKDVPSAALFSIALWTFYRGIIRGAWPWIIASAIAVGLGVAIKPNALFVPVIAATWYLFVHRTDIQRSLRKRRFEIPITSKALFLYPVVALLVLFLAWPYLWSDPLRRIYYYLSYFLEVGRVGSRLYFEGRVWAPVTEVPRYYALTYILYTIPLAVLMMSVLGLWTVGKNMVKTKDLAAPLILIWLLVPVARVSLPGAVIYDGIRQIMEILPALALLAGLGLARVIEAIGIWLEPHNKVLKKSFPFVFGLIVFSPILLQLIYLHPYQAAFFNLLAGGMKGADKSFQMDTWGSVYKEGAEWANNHLTADDVLVVPIGPHLPKYYLSSNIRLVESGDLESVAAMGKPIYIMYQTTKAAYEVHPVIWYAEHCLNPIYVVERGGAPLLKVFQLEITPEMARSLVSNPTTPLAPPECAR